ncbi:hypothetical protein PGTUg99_021354 [Puccinia graminis f. sp. tritici]|uniref:Uncharacterized protein n=1 Tax=Puccinia graminis f. sp. tritici TaxID=56615 RepID=A0A5B0PWJ7_PUCGR|nr:hypothetical protein PGTUg99_021354 [Puccinia graminis f. sp. tritici]
MIRHSFGSPDLGSAESPLPSCSSIPALFILIDPVRHHLRIASLLERLQTPLT